MARVRGYKWIDEYAVRNNFSRDEFGAITLFVIDPTTVHRKTLVDSHRNSDPTNLIYSNKEMHKNCHF